MLIYVQFFVKIGSVIFEVDFMFIVEKNFAVFIVLKLLHSLSLQLNEENLSW